jgi:hypothetical protein
MTTRTLLRLLISLTPGLGQRELNAELDRLGVATATRADLHAIGGHENALGVWCLPDSGPVEVRIKRGSALERHSHAFNRLGYATWQAERNAMVLRWARSDARKGA